VEKAANEIFVTMGVNWEFLHFGGLPFLFFLASPSAVDCGRICRTQTCAHSGIEPSTLAKGFLQDGQKVRQKFEFLTISSLYVPYISVTAKNRGLQAAYVAF